MGDFNRYISVFKRIQVTKQMKILVLGGSITAGGYYHEFVRLLELEKGINVTVHNHGHGATAIPCKNILFLFTQTHFSLQIRCIALILKNINQI